MRHRKHKWKVLVNLSLIAGLLMIGYIIINSGYEFQYDYINYIMPITATVIAILFVFIVVAVVIFLAAEIAGNGIVASVSMVAILVFIVILVFVFNSVDSFDPILIY